MFLSNLPIFQEAISEYSTLEQRHSFDHLLRDLPAVFKAVETLQQHLPLRVGDRAVLQLTPEITEYHYHGWRGFKHLLTSGQVGEIYDVLVTDDIRFLWEPIPQEAGHEAQFWIPLEWLKKIEVQELPTDYFRQDHGDE
jgi:hypothetical protein